MLKLLMSHTELKCLYWTLPEFSYLIGAIVAVLFAVVIGLIANNLRDAENGDLD